MKTFLRITKDPSDIWGDFVRIYFAAEHPDGTMRVAQTAELRTIDDNSISDTPAMLTVCIKGKNEGFLRDIMDQLWNIGVRPTDIGTPGHLAATQKHLEDMRAIAFGKLEIGKP